MKYILIALCCLSMTTVFAEIIGYVEYQLPQVAQEWIIGNKLQNDKGTTLIYIPKGSQKEKAKEFFGVNTNNLTSTNNPAAIKSALVHMHPNLQVDFQVLENANNAILYEWSAKDKEEKIHGWGRSFSTKEGTVVLGYQTEDISNIQQARTVWLKTLKEAKQR